MFMYAARATFAHSFIYAFELVEPCLCAPFGFGTTLCMRMCAITLRFSCTILWSECMAFCCRIGTSRDTILFALYNKPIQPKRYGLVFFFCSPFAIISLQKALNHTLSVQHTFSVWLRFPCDITAATTTT